MIEKIDIFITAIGHTHLRHVNFYSYNFTLVYTYHRHTNILLLIEKKNHLQRKNIASVTDVYKYPDSDLTFIRTLCPGDISRVKSERQVYDLNYVHKITKSFHVFLYNKILWFNISGCLQSFNGGVLFRSFPAEFNSIN